MKARDYQNAVPLNLEEDSVRKASDSGTPSPLVDDRELQWVLLDCLDSYVNGSCEALSKLRSDVVIPGARFFQL